MPANVHRLTKDKIATSIKRKRESVRVETKVDDWHTQWELKRRWIRRRRRLEPVCHHWKLVTLYQRKQQGEGERESGRTGAGVEQRASRRKSWMLRRKKVCVRLFQSREKRDILSPSFPSLSVVLSVSETYAYKQKTPEVRKMRHAEI